MNRIALIVCYIGSFPRYFRYSTDSAARNSDVDFYIFSDQVSQPEISGNIKILPLTLESFSSLASLKLGLNVSLSYGYKLCDFKPAYGVIFEDYLKPYDFWGYCDIDVIWGKINCFITEDILENFDIITTLETHLAGHFTLYRNNETTLNLFRYTDDYKKIFTDGTTNYHFDESCLRYGEFYEPDELKQFGKTVSMSDIAMTLKMKQKLRLYMKKVIRDHPDPICYEYRDGVLTDLNNGEEFMYHHLSHVKNDWNFFILPISQLPSTFKIVPEGIIPGSPGELLPKLKWQIGKTLFSLNYLFHRVKQFGISTSFRKLTQKITG
jgi:hypothetical protein